MALKMMRILGISLGTRDCGVAVISDGAIVEWRRHTFHGTWSEDKLHGIIRRLDRYITRYKVTRVMVKIPPVTHHTEAFRALLEKLTEHIRYRGCLMESITKEELKLKVPEIHNKENADGICDRSLSCLANRTGPGKDQQAALTILSV